jgi:hypothetical protein
MYEAYSVFPVVGECVVVAVGVEVVVVDVAVGEAEGEVSVLWGVAVAAGVEVTVALDAGVVVDVVDVVCVGEVVSGFSVELACGVGVSVFEVEAGLFIVDVTPMIPTTRTITATETRSTVTF